MVSSEFIPWRLERGGFLLSWSPSALGRDNGPDGGGEDRVDPHGFLAPMVNGVDLGPEDVDPTGTVATVDREFAVGSGRIDLMVRWPVPGRQPQRFAVELKVRRDKAGDPLQAGLRQLSDYSDRLGLDTGTLILFDLRTDAPPMDERGSLEPMEHGGRTLTVLRL